MARRLSPTAIGNWSTRRPRLAIAAWLAFVLLAVTGLALTGSKPLANGAVGESARGYAVMDAHQLGFPSQAAIYLHSDRLTIGEAGFRAAIADVAARMRAALGARVTVSLAAVRHAALVMGA